MPSMFSGISSDNPFLFVIFLFFDILLSPIEQKLINEHSIPLLISVIPFWLARFGGMHWGTESQISNNPRTTSTASPNFSSVGSSCPNASLVFYESSGEHCMKICCIQFVTHVIRKPEEGSFLSCSLKSCGDN